jgi:hypothetical protein
MSFTESASLVVEASSLSAQMLLESYCKEENHARCQAWHRSMIFLRSRSLRSRLPLDYLSPAVPIPTKYTQSPVLRRRASSPRTNTENRARLKNLLCVYLHQDELHRLSCATCAGPAHVDVLTTAPPRSTSDDALDTVQLAHATADGSSCGSVRRYSRRLAIDLAGARWDEDEWDHDHDTDKSLIL